MNVFFEQPTQSSAFKPKVQIVTSRSRWFHLIYQKNVHQRLSIHCTRPLSWTVRKFCWLLNNYFNNPTGQAMVLRCKIHALPSAAVVWSKDDVNVEEWVINKDVTTQVTLHKSFPLCLFIGIQILPGGICELLNPECYPEDSGLYKCHASNPHGTAETSAYIAVEGLFCVFIVMLM